MVRLNCSKQGLFIFGLLDNALQQVDIIRKSFFAWSGQGTSCQGTIVSKGFGD
jgi:hypothetical protein